MDANDLSCLAGILEFCKKSDSNTHVNEIKTISRAFGSHTAKIVENIVEEKETIEESATNKKKIDKEYNFK